MVAFKCTSFHVSVYLYKYFSYYCNVSHMRLTFFPYNVSATESVPRANTKQELETHGEEDHKPTAKPAIQEDHHGDRFNKIEQGTNVICCIKLQLTAD